MLREIVYREARPHIGTGDLIAFVGKPLNPGHLAIMAGQIWEGGGNGDNLWRVVHVGVAFVNEDDNEVMLAEFTFIGFLKVGFKFTRLSERIEEYGHPVIWSPLREEIRDKVNETYAMEWLDRVRTGRYQYNILGLPVAVSRVLKQVIITAARPGASFCSEGVIRCWLQIMALDRERGVLTLDGRLVDADLVPHAHSPAEVTRMKHIHQWDRIPRKPNAAILVPA
jgi:hypothetical protein